MDSIAVAESTELPVEADKIAEKSDQADLVKKWTIKGISPEARNAAIAAAERDGQTLGEWFTRAIPRIIAQNRQDNRLPAVTERADSPGRHADPQADLAQIERVIAAAKELHGITAEAPPKGVIRLAYSLLRDRLRAIRSTGPTSVRSARSDPQPLEDAA